MYKRQDVQNGSVHVQRQTEEGYDEVVCPMPCVVSVTAGVVEPRFPSFKGIMAAKSKPLAQPSLEDLAIPAESVGWAGAGQEITAIVEAPVRQAGEVVEDEGDAHERLIAFLEELKVL